MLTWRPKLRRGWDSVFAKSYFGILSKQMKSRLLLSRILIQRPKPFRWGWHCAGFIFVFVVFVGVTLGIVLPKSPNNLTSSAEGTQQTSMCTLCPDGNVTIEFPARKLPRLSGSIWGSNITCGAVASNPLLLTELLSKSSAGDCNATIQVYANYCGCTAPVSRTVQLKQCGVLWSYGFAVPRKDLVTPVFNDTCGELEILYASLSSEQCNMASAVNVKASAAYCCPAVKPACSLCHNLGDEPTLFLNPVPLFSLTCGALNDYTSILTKEECYDIGYDLPPSAGICGCPPRSCSLCGPDREMPNPSLLSLYNNCSCAALDGIIGAFSIEDCSTREDALIEENANYSCSPVAAPSHLNQPSSETAFPSVYIAGTQIPSSFVQGGPATFSPSHRPWPGTFSPSRMPWTVTLSPSVSTLAYRSLENYHPIL